MPRKFLKASAFCVLTLSLILGNAHLAESESPTVLPIREQMPYSQARQELIDRGWQPNLEGDEPNLNSSVVKTLFDLGYEEIKDCAGTGEELCRFEFVNQHNQLLVVIGGSTGRGAGEQFVRRWWIERNSGSPYPQRSRADSLVVEKRELRSCVCSNPP
ncbi:hypothetical protein LEP3755_49080 [Leptolyngbya sp. NIES-3755]|nr:hypothetical protein LEP3755_49080 [Leptolyngbya sp. NIES-3755]